MAALFLKGPSDEERMLSRVMDFDLLSSPERIIQYVGGCAPENVKSLCLEILKGRSLVKEEALNLGRYLLSEHGDDGLRGLCASALRIRYETADEFESLLNAMEETKEKNFTMPVPEGPPVIQFAEPFDGVKRSYLITPLIADFFQRKGYRCVCLTGRNSGPKFGMNLSDLANQLGLKFMHNSRDWTESRTDFGHYVHQADISRAVDRWVEIRRQIVKRPFAATLERFMNPCDASIVVASAFHPPYVEKMLTIAERAGFPAAVVVRNGQEGTLSACLNRPYKMLCTARMNDGTYRRHAEDILPEEFLNREIKADIKLDNVRPSENALRIQRYHETGTSGDGFFDMRVRIACEGLRRAAEWIEENRRAGP